MPIIMESHEYFALRTGVFGQTGTFQIYNRLLKKPSQKKDENSDDVL